MVGYFESWKPKKEMLPIDRKVECSIMKPLFCDYISQSYSAVAMFFEVGSYDTSELKVETFYDYCIRERLDDLEHSSDTDKKDGDELNKLAQEINGVLKSSSIDFITKGLRFFEVAIKAAKIACSEESVKDYTKALCRFKNKQELA